MLHGKKENKAYHRLEGQNPAVGYSDICVPFCGQFFLVFSSGSLQHLHANGEPYRPVRCPGTAVNSRLYVEKHPDCVAVLTRISRASGYIWICLCLHASWFQKTVWFFSMDGGG